MNGAAFVIAAWIFMGLELGLKDALSLGSVHVAPSFMFCLLTFIAMFSSHPKPTWCAIGLGVLMDLTFRVPLRDGIGTVTLIGPYSIAYVVGVQLITAMRGLVIKRNPLTVGFLAFTGSIVTQVVLVGVLSLRMWWGDPIFGPSNPPSAELLARLGSAAYTGLLGCAISLVMFPIAPWMGLQVQARRR
jgi:hypothetical protein